MDPQSIEEIETLAVLELVGADADPATSDGLARCRALRRVVFVDEQGVPEALEWDGLDGEADHFLAVVLPAPDAAATGKGPPRLDPSAETVALGTARLRIVDGDAKAERVAVHREARRLGIGRRLMQALEDRARRRGLRRVILHAQVIAIPFYERLGYTAHGDVFLDAGIDHREMSKPIA